MQERNGNPISSNECKRVFKTEKRLSFSYEFAHFALFFIIIIHLTSNLDLIISLHTLTWWRMQKDKEEGKKKVDEDGENEENKTK